jgi:hypothetical protein
MQANSVSRVIQGPEENFKFWATNNTELKSPSKQIRLNNTKFD